ncbi:XylR family transcriptional regulator [Rubritalea tangerina]|uniref:XylR family transcriptional regulator n=1 Tax=Rubritalea tangerina TaxID=430798 RepID=A0ABW4Z822_9BACT
MPSKRVAILIESSTQYGRNLLLGIAKFARLHDWDIKFEQGGMNRPEPEWLKNWDGDGVITRVKNPSYSNALDPKRTVVINNYSPESCADGVHFYTPTDNGASVGNVAADYFVTKGYRNFAYIGISDAPYSPLRQQGFEEALAKKQLTCQVHLDPEHPGDQLEQTRQDQLTFLKSLPLPCAIFVANDSRATEILNLCNANGLSIPKDIAIIGVDNDEVICSLCAPTLSSISPNVTQMGWDMAAHLDALMNHTSPPERKPVPAIQVFERQSTKIEAVDDSAVTRATRIIQNSVTTMPSIEDIARASGVSRRTLERKFQENLKLSVKAYINQTLMARAKTLLLDTHFTVEHIARQLGISHMQKFYHLFAKETGTTPGNFRQSHQ